MTAGAGTFNFATGALTAKDKGNDNDQFVAPPLFLNRYRFHRLLT